MPRSSTLCLLLYALAAGQLSAQQPRGISWEPDRARSGSGQLAIELGVLSAGLSYAQRLGSSRFRLGLGLWGAWEPATTVDQPVLEPIGGVLFVRYQPSSSVMVDLGPAVMSYRTSDDCSTCSATFMGVRSAVLVGYRFVFIGPEVALGSFSSGGRGKEFGIMYGAQLRFVIGGGAR